MHKCQKVCPLHYFIETNTFSDIQEVFHNLSVSVNSFFLVIFRFSTNLEIFETQLLLHCYKVIPNFLARVVTLQVRGHSHSIPKCLIALSLQYISLVAPGTIAPEKQMYICTHCKYWKVLRLVTSWSSCTHRKCSKMFHMQFTAFASQSDKLSKN